MAVDISEFVRGRAGPQQISQGLDLKDLDEDAVKQVVQQELSAALGQNGGQLSADRLKAQSYYNGEPLGTEVEGRSQVVMLNVLEAVEWVLPALLRIFTASDQICVVEPSLPGQEQQAKQATDYVNHIFHRDNPGFLLLHDFFKTALLEKTGWMRWRWDTQKTTETETYSGLTKEQYDAILGQDDDVEVVRLERWEQPADEFNLDRPFPQPQPVLLHDCTLRVTRSNGRVRLEGIPPEEILVSRRATRDSLPFLAHRRKWSYSDLIQQGYDADSLDEVPMSDTEEWNSEERALRHRLDEDWPPLDRRDAAKEIWVEESYVQLAKTDADTTDLYKVVTAGNGLIILTKDGEPDIEPVDEIPFVSICPIPQPHKLIGLSLADLVMDLQLIKSTLLRQMLDNAYLSNWPRTEIADDVANENTYDDLLTLRPGGIVRTKRVGGLVPLTIPYTADKSFPLIEYLDQTQEVRTGVARHNQGINPDDLNKTATGVSLLQQAAAQRVELFARLFAHGVEAVCRGIMGLVRKHQQQERIIRITGQWMQVDPRQWRDAMPVTVSVGLGTGNRDQLLAHLMQLLQVQGQIVLQQGGPKGPLVYPEHVYAVAKALTEAAGFKTQFFADPSQPPPPQPPQPPPPPDPAVMKAQAAMQSQQMKAQADVEAIQAKAGVAGDLLGKKAMAEIGIQQQRLEHEKQMAMFKAQNELTLEREKAANDLTVAMERAKIEGEVKRREIELKYAAGAYSSEPPKPNVAADAGA